MRGTCQTRVARIIWVEKASLGSRCAGATVGANEIVVRIHLARLGAGFRGGADLPIGAIDAALALIVAPLIRGALERRRTIAVVQAMRLNGQLTNRRLVGGNYAALARWAIGRHVAGVVALSHGAHQGPVAVAIEYARAAHIYLLRRATTDHEPR